MKYKLMALDISVVLVSYLIMMMPVVSAYFTSAPLNGISVNSEPEEPQTDVFSIISKVLMMGLDRLIPSAWAAECGDYYCDAGAGETIENCCYDCECGRADYYCHIETGAGPGTGICRDLTRVNMSYRAISNTSFVDCSKPHKTNVTASIDNQPGGVTLDVKTWFLNHSSLTDQISEECVEGAYPNYYICPVIIPALPNCGEGEFVLENNKLVFNISYNNGRFRDIMGMFVHFPAITIQSWECGNDICEEDLGEGYDNCCIDCGCPEDTYCDTESRTVPGPSTCETVLSSTHVSILNATPVAFPTHTPGDKVKFDLEIHNKPQSLELPSQACELSCRWDSDFDSGECETSCAVSCASQLVEPNATIYNTTCELTFTIADYNRTYDYRLRPSLNFSVKYNNGTEQITDVLTKEDPFSLVVSKSFCGDLFCDTQYENQGTCCYDCGCGEGEHCDITDEEKVFMEFNKGVCKRLDNITMTGYLLEPNLTVETKVLTQMMGPFEQKTVVTKSEKAWISFDIRGKPKSLKNFIPTCSFTEGYATEYPCLVDIPCHIGTTMFTDQLNITCAVNSPEVAYKEVGTNLIGRLDFTLTFNDGANETEKMISKLFSITMNVTPGCGNGQCEEDLEETYDSCCLDCEPPEGFVCVGDAGENYIFNPGEIRLDIKDQVFTCLVSDINEDCEWTETVEFPAEIRYALGEIPEDLQIVESLFKFKGETENLYCELESGFEEQNVNYTCRFDPLPVENPYTLCPSLTANNPCDQSQGVMEFQWRLSFMAEGGQKIQTINDTADVIYTLTETQAIQNCRDAVADAQGDVDDAEDEAETWKTLSTIFMLLAVGFGICGIWVDWCKVVAVIAGVLGCLLWAFEDELADDFEDLDDAVDSVNSLCGDVDSTLDLGAAIDSLEDDLDDVEDDWDTAVTAGQIGCAIALITIAGSTGGGGSAAPASTTVKLVACFLGSTSVLMADGTYKDIEDVVVGDKVMSYDESTDSLVEKSVAEIFHHGKEEFEIHGYVIINGKVRVTPNHPVYINGKMDWAYNIKTGDVLLDENMNGVEVTSIEYVLDPVDVVYHIALEDGYGYFADGVFVSS